MKKIAKLLLFNVLILIFILLIIELFLAFKEYDKGRRCDNNSYKTSELVKFTFNHFQNLVDFKYFYDYEAILREKSHFNYPKPFIVLMGCSFTHGSTLNDHETFNYVLANYIKHPVYNLGVSSGSTREMLYFLRNKELFKYYTDEKTENIEYIIYTFIPDHLYRMIYDPYIYSPHFEVVNVTSDGNLKKHLVYRKLNKTLKKIFICRYIEEHKFYKYNNNLLELFNLYISEINDEIKKNYKPAKFVIFIYEDSNKINWDLYEQQGIKVIKAKDILNVNLQSNEYYISDMDHHPNAKAWQVIVPALAKELNL